MPAVYSQPSPQKPISVYYTGTDTLAQGYAFCYDLAVTDGSQAWSVAKPATLNLDAFAGVLADSSIGKVGPCWIEIIPPNCVASARINIGTLTLGTDRLKVINGSYGLTKVTPGGSLTATAVGIPLEAMTYAAATVGQVLLKGTGV